ncbi:MAG: hypothetical protein ACREOE_04750, partial [Gemmatimonadales bacterium]
MKQRRTIRGRRAVPVALALCATVAGCSWGRVANPLPEAKGSSLATVPGRIALPAGASGGNWVVVADGRRFLADATGRFTARLRRNAVVALTASRSGQSQGGLAAIVTGTPSSIRLDAGSTAAALVFLDPELSTANTTRAAEILGVLRADPSVAGLSATVTRELETRRSATDPAVTAAYGQALASAVHALDTPSGAGGGITTTVPSTTTTVTGTTTTVAGTTGAMPTSSARSGGATLVDSASACPTPV